MPVDEAGRFTSEVPDYAGMQVFESNRYVIADLREGTGTWPSGPQLLGSAGAPGLLHALPTRTAGVAVSPSSTRL